MDQLNTINSTFENVRTAIKTKKSSDSYRHLKSDIQRLSFELVSLGKENHEQLTRSLAMEGYLALLSAKIISLPLVEKRNVLQVAFDKLKPHATKEECLFIFLRIQNLLCYYLIHLDQLALAQNILDNMEDLYDKIGKSKSDQYYDTEDLFSPIPLTSARRVNPEKIDRIITNNIQMQAFIYNKQKCPDKYVCYNYMALRRQLEMKDGTPQEWAMKTARFGNYLTNLNQMANARHHLTAAYHVLRTCHDNCKLIPEEFVLQKADFEMHILELSHLWVKYGLTLFKLSKQKFLNQRFSRTREDPWTAIDELDEQDVMIEENDKDQGSEKPIGDYTAEELLKFPTLDLTSLEAKVPLNLVSNVVEARKLFNFTQKWLKRAKHYYDMDHYPAQYISCTLQLTELYEHLAFFEADVDNQYYIQKKRSETLENLNILLKSCDNVSSVHIDVIRELSQVQLEMMALNLQKLWREESHTDFTNLDETASSVNSFNSIKTLTEHVSMHVPSKNMFLKKMQAVTSINGKLLRLSGQLSPSTPSQFSLNSQC